MNDTCTLLTLLTNIYIKKCTMKKNVHNTCIKYMVFEVVHKLLYCVCENGKKNLYSRYVYSYSDPTLMISIHLSIRNNNMLISVNRNVHIILFIIYYDVICGYLSV